MLGVRVQVLRADVKVQLLLIIRSLSAVELDPCTFKDTLTSADSATASS